MTMSPEQSAVSAAADEADDRTDAESVRGPGVWHQHFLDVLAEGGWGLVRQPVIFPGKKTS